MKLVIKTKVQASYFVNKNASVTNTKSAELATDNNNIEIQLPITFNITQQELKFGGSNIQIGYFTQNTFNSKFSHQLKTIATNFILY